MKLIGFVGPKQAGKDTAALILKDLKVSRGKLSFAGPLKRICSEIFNIPAIMLEDPILKEKAFKEPLVLTRKHLRDVKNKCVEILDPYTDGGEIVLYNPNKATIIGLENRTINSPRELLQIIGTDFIRNRIFEGWHLNAAFSDATLEYQKKQHGVNAALCVTDIRFVNEYLYLKNRFGSDFNCFYILRPDAEKILESATHASELETKKIRELLTDSVIKNEGNVDELKETLSKLELLKEVKAAKKSRAVFVDKNGKRID
jgi:hypothetical protein